MIRIENLRKRFGAFEAVRGVSLSVPEGSFLVLVGPSGCGKSTMLRMLAGLEIPSDGTIAYHDRVVSDGTRGWMIDAAKRDNGLVFQSYALWPHMTVAGNVDWPLRVAGMSKTERRGRVDEVLNLMGIAPLAGRYPNEISGGQQQRVAIARMIAPKPRILLFDEPLSNLDAKLRVEMRTELLRIHRSTGATSVYVTHDQVEAMTMASHVAVMNEGRIEQFGTPRELIENPATAFVATFVGTPPANLVPITPAKRGEGTAHLAVPPDFEGFAMFRPEEIAVSDASSDAVVLDYAEASPVAGRVMVTGTGDRFRLTAVAAQIPDLKVGDRIGFKLPPKPSALFSLNGDRVS
jgi:iron(III) transport system ATP-binding protein